MSSPPLDRLPLLSSSRLTFEFFTGVSNFRGLFGGGRLISVAVISLAGVELGPTGVLCTDTVSTDFTHLTEFSKLSTEALCVKRGLNDGGRSDDANGFLPNSGVSVIECEVEGCTEFSLAFFFGRLKGSGRGPSGTSSP
ncbi:leucyl/phenylalanyl-tRNA--protein transferase [Striga asiatica]|uniref:Leucyl/phenylalanyl-tRNA--protein transferase n=1 Tax=Striga asiatica TaxID=4170 RepID=A0A5A7PAJ3_STRAF|nr:leucyl/phenylalanyl-tRNA--protein transferase [Striga asiatica]